MNLVDAATIAVYLAFVLGLGFWMGRRIRSGKDFFLGGRLLPWWAIGMSLVVSDIGAKDIVGLAQDSYRHGWVMANWDWIGCIPAMILAGLVFVPYFWAGGFYTVPEYFGRRYNEGVRAISTIVWGLFIAGNIAVIFSASTGVITTMLGLEGFEVSLGQWGDSTFALNGETIVLAASAVFVGIYAYRGGLAAVVYTDVLQCLLMILGMGLVLYFGFHHESVGSWEALREKVTAEHPDHLRLFHPSENPSSFTCFSIIFGLGIVLGPAYWIGNQVIVQRVLGARSLEHARWGVFFGAFVKSVFPLLLVLPGILALVILPFELTGDEETKKVFPMLIKDLLPEGVRGLVFAAMAAGMMGNLDSYLNSASTLWTRDILRQYFFRGAGLDAEASGKLDLRIGRILTLVFLVVGTCLSTFISSIFETMQWMLSMFQGPSLALLLFGMFWKRTTAWGGLAGIVLGLGSAALLDWKKKALFGYWRGESWIGYDSPYLHVAWWSFVVSCVAVVAVSFLTEPHSKERLRGLVFGSPRGGGDG